MYQIISADPTSISGRVGSMGVAKTPDVAPVVTASSAYTTGVVVGGLLHFSNVARSNVNTGLIQSVIVTCASLQTASFDVVFFNANPSATTFTDKSALALNASDLSKIVGIAHCSDVTGFSGASVHQATGLALPFNSANADLYCAVVVRGTPTFATTSDVNLVVRVIQD